MFEKVVIKRHRKDGSLDVGLLAETLLYYSNVHILFNNGSLSSALKTIGPETLLSLIEERRITGTFFPDMLATVTDTVNNVQFHRYSAITIVQDADGKKLRPRDWAGRIFESSLGGGTNTKKYVQRFLDAVPIRFYEPTDAPPILSDAARGDLEDRAYVRSAVEEILRNAVPSYNLPSRWHFYAVPMGDKRFVVNSDLDLAALNLEYHKTVPPSQNTITYAWLLNQMLDVRSDVQFAADYMSEFVTDPTASSIARKKFSDILKRRSASAEQIDAFQDVILNNGAAIQEVIDSGERSFDEFLSILRHADKFKEWLRTSNPDGSLLAEYHRAAFAETWLERLPPKVVRFAMFALGGAGLEALFPGGTGVAAGLTLSAADQFLLDRLMGGWKPSQFVEGPLKTFAKP